MKLGTAKINIRCHSSPETRGVLFRQRYEVSGVKIGQILTTQYTYDPLTKGQKFHKREVTTVNRISAEKYLVARVKVNIPENRTFRKLTTGTGK